MQKRALIVGIVMLTMGLVPAASGNHMSVGSQDAVGMSPDETPGDKSVPDDRHAVGTTSTDDCFDDDGEAIDPENAADVADKTVEAANNDAFCGRLDYNPDIDQFNAQSPVDQDLRGPIEGGTWDVLYASYAGNYGLSTCYPWCLPGGINVYRAAHDAMSEQGLSDNGETAAREDDDGWQEYAMNVLYPNALILAQQETGTWEMDGWAHTVHDQQFIGFLEDSNGEVIDDGRLSDIVDEENLPNDAIPHVCGFSPDTEIVIDAPGASFCEVLFRWAEPSDEGTDYNTDNYDNPCTSPTYVCGAAQPAWYAQLVCKTFFSLGGVNPGSFGCAGGDYVAVDGEDGPAWSDNDYDIWHWVVAPSPSECAGAQEPGFVVETPTGASFPYLAHDLDVYTPAATAVDEKGTENVENYLRSTADKTIPDPSEGSDQVPSTTELLPPEIQKTDRVEPNAAGDTSQSVFDEDRVQEPCDVLRGGLEEYIDPWVDYIDNQAMLDPLGDPVAGGLDIYLNDDPYQDASNRPGYAMYFTSGQLGVFTDKNDDGDYDQASSDNKLQAVNAVGAYPMPWDVNLNETKLEEDQAATVAAMEGGCTPGFSEFDWAEEAGKAGYGPHTGLMQIVYLREPTVLFNWITDDTIPFQEGHNAFVQLSPGFQKLHNNTDTRPFIEAQVTDALKDIPADDPDIVYTHNLTEPGVRDFYDQCASPTGGFTNTWGFVHSCGAEAGGDLCADDTIVTRYVFENLDTNGVLGGSGSNFPVLEIGGQETAFPMGVNAWTDVDPFDGDPSRNTNSCDRPQHHESGHSDPCGFDEDGHHDG